MGEGCYLCGVNGAYGPDTNDKKTENKMKKTNSLTRRQLIAVCCVVVAFGTVMHFVHEMPFYNHFLSLIFPANECVWEHMKMVFWPFVLMGIWLCLRRRSLGALGGPVAAGLLAMPVTIGLFYVYWPFTHHSILIVDIILYTVVMIVGVFLAERWSHNAKMQRLRWLWLAAALATVLLMAYLTDHAPDNFLFRV